MAGDDAAPEGELTDSTPKTEQTSATDVDASDVAGSADR
jgi:hypothetical protein